MTERTVEANGAELCIDAVGEPRDPPILLVMGMGASLVWWDDEFTPDAGGRAALRDPL